MKFIHYIFLISIGLIFHILFGYSILDTYYNFSLNYGMTPHSSNLSEFEIPSNRIVLFILDGSRADTFFDAISRGKTPYLRDIIENRGVYGISFTKVPTESLPCFTAIFSGHFQDGSLALRHLYNIPILTDTILNQSDYSWGIGHMANHLKKMAKKLEIIKKKEIFKPKINGSYNFEVCETMVDYLEKAKKNNKSENYKKLFKNKIIFMLHLDETDDLGHDYGPTSDIMINHHIQMNSYYEKVENAFYDFYHDNKTTFIITSDHGMNPGYHGDDTPECKRNPFVAWGAGIRKAIYREQKPIEEDTPSEWGLDNVSRSDIMQIDIAPLSAGLLGINFPINSFGRVPYDILNVSEKIKSKILFGNMMEIIETYNIKISNRSKSVFFIPYKPLNNYKNKIDDIQKDINNKNYIDAINKTNILINTTLDGIDYVWRYDRPFLKSIITTGYILWMLFLFVFLEMKNDNNLNKFFCYNSDKNKTNIFSGIITLFLLIYLFLRISPLSYYLYTLFCCYFFWRIISNIEYLQLFFVKTSDVKTFFINLFIFIFVIISFFYMVSI